jgi:hypothetical protein
MRLRPQPRTKIFQAFFFFATAGSASFTACDEAGTTTVGVEPCLEAHSISWHSQECRSVGITDKPCLRGVMCARLASAAAEEPSTRTNAKERGNSNLLVVPGSTQRVAVTKNDPSSILLSSRRNGDRRSFLHWALNQTDDLHCRPS